MRFRIGHSAACVLGLDGGAADEMGVRVVASSRVTLTIEASRERACSLAAELEQRSDGRGGGWDLMPAERAACRRAARAMRKRLGAT